jgi:hypothetical protein
MKRNESRTFLALISHRISIHKRRHTGGKTYQPGRQDRSGPFLLSSHGVAAHYVAVLLALRAS